MSPVPLRDSLFLTRQSMLPIVAFSNPEICPNRLKLPQALGRNLNQLCLSRLFWQHLHAFAEEDPDFANWYILSLTARWFSAGTAQVRAAGTAGGVSPLPFMVRHVGCGRALQKDGSLCREKTTKVGDLVPRCSPARGKVCGQ
jgi:hypothetical protein